MEVGKYIAGTLFVLLAVGIYFAGTSLTSVSCTGWNIINPICWGGVALDFTLDLLILIIAIFIAVVGILMFALPQEKVIWLVGFGLLGVVFIVTLIIPDPLPMADEILLGIGTTFMGFKSVTDVKVKEMF